ncbi:MAG TPA: response regulator [Caulobacteraceae bacterium]|nr:response regulator [Caulobacteraceae bacterium]
MSSLVLLLEDDWRSAEALALLLDDWGYECVHGPSLDVAFAAVRERSGEVRAVISDYHLQGGATGIEAAQAAAGHGIAAPVLLLTGTLRGGARRAAEAAGYRFMEKPVAPARLKAWLDEAAPLHA